VAAARQAVAQAEAQQLEVDLDSSPEQDEPDVYLGPEKHYVV
jgi:hypothetical protein